MDNPAGPEPWPRTMDSSTKGPELWTSRLQPYFWPSAGDGVKDTRGFVLRLNTSQYQPTGFETSK